MEFLGKKGRGGKRTEGARTRWGAGQPGGHTTGDAAGTADLPKGRAAWSRKVNKELGAEGTRGVRARGTPRSNSRRKQRASGMCELKTEAGKQKRAAKCGGVGLVLFLNGSAHYQNHGAPSTLSDEGYEAHPRRSQGIGWCWIFLPARCGGDRGNTRRLINKSQNAEYAKHTDEEYQGDLRGDKCGSNKNGGKVMDGRGKGEQKGAGEQTCHSGAK